MCETEATLSLSVELMGVASSGSLNRKSKDGERDREFAVNGVSDRTLVYRAYEIAAMAGASAGIDRFVLEGLLGHGTGPLIASMVDKGQLVEVGNGTRLLAGRAPTHS